MISLRGARLHNLQNVNADFPENSITVVCGPSGCGKSSLSFDTLHGECRRRYLETLSPFALRVLGGKKYIPLDDASGLIPSVAIGPARGEAPARTMALSLAEADDAFHTLFCSMARPTCPVCGKSAEFLTREQIVAKIAEYPEKSRLQFIAPAGMENAQGKTLSELASVFLPLGYSRGLADGVACSLADLTPQESRKAPKKFEIVVDRIIIRDGVRTRISEAVDACFRLTHDYLEIDNEGVRTVFSTVPRCPEGHEVGVLQAPQVRNFSPYSTVGACEHCGGTGFENEEREILCKHCNGLRLKPFLLNSRIGYFDANESPDVTVNESSNVTANESPCATANESSCVIANEVKQSTASSFSYSELVQKNFVDFKNCCEKIFANVPRALARTRETLFARLEAIEELGLGYLQPCRSGCTLSSGELERLRLVSAVTGYLDGMLFCLDEPAAGLHKEDAIKLWNVLEKICRRGNTLVLMEHNPEIISRADWIIEMGPGAGELGGSILAMGKREEVLSNQESPTGNWLRKLEKLRKKSPSKKVKNKPSESIVVDGFTEYGIKPISANFPVGKFSVVTGPSGCGKSTLMFKYLVEEYNKGSFSHLGLEALSVLSTGNFQGNRRSTVASAIDLLVPLRDLFAKLPESKIRGYAANRFSLHTPGGRCETCKGEGVLLDPSGFEETECPICQGKRYRDEILEIRFKSLSIADILDMSVENAMNLFEAFPKFYPKLRALVATGLGYLRLGQVTSNMSSGERARLRLSMALGKNNPPKTLYLFDEPARGLHEGDIKKLLDLFHGLADLGHTIIAIEHSEDFVASADYVLELTK